MSVGTAQLRAMADWLKQCEIRTVSLQSTGVYWIAVFGILEEAGFEVYLVNARETKNLPGRKSDVQESLPLMYFHFFFAGLALSVASEIRFSSSFSPVRNAVFRAAGSASRDSQNLSPL